MQDEKPLHSFHAFLFPFEWKPKIVGNILLEDQTDLKRIRPAMEAPDSHWKLGDPWSKPSSLVQYNEANYFYDFVRPVLYGDKNAKYQVHYQHRLASGGQYIIHLQNGTSFELELDDIGLSFFNTGIGILSFHCYNRIYKEPDQILQINQFGRRIYPPFFGTNTDLIANQAFFEDTEWSKGLKRVKDAELAHSITLKKGTDVLAVDNFNDWITGDPDLEQAPGLLRQVLPTALLSTLSITPVLDDRMFVVCWYGNDKLANTIRSFDEKNVPERDWWYKFVFVDAKFKTCQNDALTQEQLNNHSNVRWLKYGTLYGVSRYSFVCLTSTLETLRLPNINAAFLPSHVQTHYFKLAELALLQRGCVMRFSDEVTAISDLPDNNKRLGAHVSSLYKQYIRFVNKIYFREVTAQEQGIELYDLLQKHMRIADQVTSLDNEIGELHNYVMLLEEDRRNAKLDTLTYIGAFFVVPSFVCTYVGLFDSGLKKDPIGLGVTCIASALLFLGIIRLNGFWRWLFLFLACLLVFYVLFLSIP